MWWQVAAVAAKSLLGGINSATAAYNQKAQNSMNESDALVQTTAENKAIAEANLQNTIRNGYRQGLLAVQRAQAARRSREQGIDLQRAVKQTLGAATANAAAAGAVGASVDAIAQEIAVAQDQADAEQSENARVTVENFDTQLHDLVQAGQDALRSDRKVNVRKPTNTPVPGYLENIIGAGMDAWASTGYQTKLG